MSEYTAVGPTSGFTHEDLLYSLAMAPQVAHQAPPGESVAIGRELNNNEEDGNPMADVDFWMPELPTFSWEQFALNELCQDEDPPEQRARAFCQTIVAAESGEDNSAKTVLHDDTWSKSSGEDKYVRKEDCPLGSLHPVQGLIYGFSGGAFATRAPLIAGCVGHEFRSQAA